MHHSFYFLHVLPLLFLSSLCFFHLRPTPFPLLLWLTCASKTFIIMILLLRHLYHTLWYCLFLLLIHTPESLTLLWFLCIHFPSYISLPYPLPHVPTDDLIKLSFYLPSFPSTCQCHHLYWSSPHHQNICLLHVSRDCQVLFTWNHLYCCYNFVLITNNLPIRVYLVILYLTLT